MNRTQRRYYGRPPRRFQRDIPRIGKRKRTTAEVEEVFPPRWRRNMQSRCCYTTPDRLDSDEGTDSPAEYIAAAKRLASSTRPVHSDITAVARRQLEKVKTKESLLKDILTTEDTTKQQKEISSKIKLNREKQETQDSPMTDEQKETRETMPLVNSTIIGQVSLNKLHRESVENRRKMAQKDYILKSQRETTENRHQIPPKSSILKSQRDTNEYRHEILSQDVSKTQRAQERRQSIIPYIQDLDIQLHRKRMMDARRNYEQNYTPYNNYANPRKQYGGETRRLVLPTFKSVAQQYSFQQVLNLDVPNKAVMTTKEQIQEYKCECARPAVENCCQYVTTDFGDNELLSFEKPVLKRKDEGTLTKYHNVPKNLQISEVPNVKIVAVKFTKYNKDNIELRRIDEKIVCVEHEMFDKEDGTKPVQRLRAFFSIKPPGTETEEDVLTELPSTVKTKFNISDIDLKTLSQKEIEIIDETIKENQPYLHDLRTILRRKQNYAELTKETLDLHALYEMGKQELLHFDYNLSTNELTKDKLKEMQNLILRNTKSSVHGIRRMTVKNSKVFESPSINRISKSLVNELLKGSTETVAF